MNSAWTKLLSKPKQDDLKDNDDDENDINVNDINVNDNSDESKQSDKKIKFEQIIPKAMDRHNLQHETVKNVSNNIHFYHISDIHITQSVYQLILPIHIYIYIFEIAGSEYQYQCIS